jgi:signal transduction histidine kinase
LQELAGLKLLLGAVRRSEDPIERLKVLEDASGRIDLAIRSLRGLITDLRPVALDDLGLGSALAALADRVRQASGLTIDLTVDFAYESGREASRLDRETEESIYRLVQECLSNVVKHAGASTVQVSVRESAETVEVTVRDDGIGFDGASPSQGFGLVGMRERVALINGSMEIETEPGEGTAVMLQLPAERQSSPLQTDVAI